MAAKIDQDVDFIVHDPLGCAYVTPARYLNPVVDRLLNSCLCWIVRGRSAVVRKYFDGRSIVEFKEFRGQESNGMAA
jgi:hypothetical protein